MPQNLIQIPETVEFSVLGYFVAIKNHEFATYYGLFGRINDIIRDSYSSGETLYQFEKHGISYEAAIECCVSELEHDTNVLANAISGHYKIWVDNKEGVNWLTLVDFSGSDTGRVMASQFIEMIRSCDDWEQLYDHMQLNSKFQKEMKGKINGWLEQ